MRKFLEGQGYDMGPVRVYQDNLSCMSLMARGRSGTEKLVTSTSDISG